jgi:multisubunit Na+/H+ antiporter MnhG subunit
MTVIVHLLVWSGVAVQLACCVGLATMRRAIDRLHFAGAATSVGPALVAAAVCVEEGLFSTNGLNAIAVAAMLALLGGALGIGTARAIRLRDRGTLESSRAERERGERAP